jgi:hypothetical protein
MLRSKAPHLGPVFGSVGHQGQRLHDHFVVSLTRSLSIDVPPIGVNRGARRATPPACTPMGRCQPCLNAQSGGRQGNA